MLSVGKIQRSPIALRASQPGGPMVSGKVNRVRLMRNSALVALALFALLVVERTIIFGGLR
jgi:hypothetical protein